jgi:hypothetical protein
MGSLRLFTANTRAVRTFIFSRPFYSIFQHRRLNNLFGNRPKHLAEIGTIDQKIWEKYQTYLKRLESHSYIAKILRTLELPQEIRSFLAANFYPDF